MLTNAWAGVYHVGADGAYQKGWLKLEDGKMARNEWVDGGKYFVNENGVWVPNAKK